MKVIAEAHNGYKVTTNVYSDLTVCVVSSGDGEEAVRFTYGGDPPYTDDVNFVILDTNFGVAFRPDSGVFVVNDDTESKVAAVISLVEEEESE